MATDKKEIVQMICALGGMALGTFLIIFGIIAPPVGILDPSVNVALGEVLSFVGAIIGIDYNYRKKINEFSRNWGNGGNDKEE